LRDRVLTALVAIPIVLGAVLCSHPIPIAVLCTFVFFLAATEYQKLSSRINYVSAAASTLSFACILLIWSLSSPGLLGYVILLLALFTGVSSAMTRFKKGDRSGGFAEVPELFGWMGAPLIAACLLHGTTELWRWDFRNPILMLLLPLWAGDTAGILVGMHFGKHKLAPSISPKKTVEGGVGNLAAAVAAGVGTAILLHYPLWVGGACGVLIGVLGQCGDLFESWLKRCVDIKDSGTLLPGHGGVLDRVDSLLFAAIPVALFIALTVR
jgi:phosphatidate cytidylyltransferase